jgi:predicted RNase H-like HicB family nuclease
MNNKKMTQERYYTVLLEREDDGGYHAFCPTLPGCHSQGDTYDEAVKNIEDAVQLYLESLQSHGLTDNALQVNSLGTPLSLNF